MEDVSQGPSQRPSIKCNSSIKFASSAFPILLFSQSPVFIMLLCVLRYRIPGVAFVFQDHIIFLFRKTKGEAIVQNLQRNEVLEVL